MGKNICFFLLIAALQTTVSQNIRIIDAETQSPVMNVAVFNKDKTETQVSDMEGLISLSGFTDTEAITFQHLGYVVQHSTKAQIVRNDNRMYLIPTSQQLEEIVVSASKWRQKKTDIPQKVTSISRNEAMFTNPQTSADLLQNNGNVFVQKSQLGGGSPMIRGLATNRLLITVDGIRMNNAIFRGGNLQNVISLDPLAVESTEVIFGPGAVTYGSDAIGGAMNFFTIDPVFSTTGPVVVQGSSLVRYSSANQEKTVHGDIRYGFNKWAFATSISYSDFDDLRMGKHGPEEYLRPEYIQTVNGTDVMVENSDPRVQTPTGYNQINVLQKIKYKPNESWNYTGGLYYSTTSDYARYDRLIRYQDDHLRHAEWYYGPQKWFLGNLQINHKADRSFYNEIKLTNAYQYFEESRNDRAFQSESLFNTREKLDAFSSNLDLEKKFNARYHLFYGLEYIYNKVHSAGSELNITTGDRSKTASRYPDGATWQSAAAYTSLEFKPGTKVTVSSGLRYNHIFMEADFTENNEFYNFPFTTTSSGTGALTGSAGLSWNPNKTFNWKLQFSTAFRSPNIDDTGKIFDSEPGSVVVPNPGLKPEYAYNGEMGVHINLKEKVNLGIAAYYTYLTNAMVRRPFSYNGESQILYNGVLSNVQAIQNAANAKVYGIEASAGVNITGNLELTSHLTYTQGTEVLDDGTEAPLRHAPPLFGSTHLTWKTNRLTIDLFADYNGEIAFEDLAPSEQSKDYIYATNADGNPYSPSWYTLNVKTRYNIFEPITLSFGVENITNQRYRPYSSGIAAPGTNVIVGAVYNF